MKSFLSPLVGADAGRFVLENTRTGAIVAGNLLVAFERAARNKGLLGRESLAEGTAMIIAPCASVHTFFMRFAIDIAFVAKDGRVVKTRTAIAPWRLAGAFRSFAVVELPAGALARSHTIRGDVLAVRASPRA